jgi:hypothetical protein
VIKKTVAKKHVIAIATKKQLQKTQVKKVWVQENQFKKKLHAMKLSDCN